MVTVIDPFLRSLPSGDAAFGWARNLEGRVLRSVKNRRTVCIHAQGVDYYVKYHGGVGYAEILKNLFQFKLPVVDASNEYLAIERLGKSGVNVPGLAGFGVRGINPAARESFIVTRGLDHTISLEKMTAGWRRTPPHRLYRHVLIGALATAVGRMHAAGVNHRDCYLCHFHCHPLEPERIFVIDLHRAQIRGSVPRRYRVKDLAGLVFSSFDAGLTMRDVLRFAAVYRRITGVRDRRLLGAVLVAARRLYAKEYRKPAPVI